MQPENNLDIVREALKNWMHETCYEFARLAGDDNVERTVEPRTAVEDFLRPMADGLALVEDGLELLDRVAENLPRVAL